MERVRLKRHGDTVDVAIRGKAAGYCVRASWGPVWFAYDLAGRTIAGPGGTGVYGGLLGAVRAVVEKSRGDAVLTTCVKRLRQMRAA